MWNYLYLMLHVGSKRDAELSGQEAYVRRCIQDNNIGFFPFLDTLAVTNNGRQSGVASGQSGGGGGDKGGGGADFSSDDTLELSLAIKRQNTVIENLKSAVENRGDTAIGVSRAVEVELRMLSKTIKEELGRLKEELDVGATTDNQRIERQLLDMQDAVTNRLDRVVVVVGRATRGSTGGGDLA